MNNPTNTAKRRFNVIDILILLTLLVIAAFAANYIVNDMFSKELAEVNYILRVDGVSEGDINRLTAGDSVAANAAGTTLGKIRDISVSEQSKAVYSADTGRFVYTRIPGKYTLYLRVNAVCTHTDHRYRIGDYLISAGLSPEILLPFSFENAAILSVTPVEKPTPDTLSEHTGTETKETGEAQTA